MIGYKKDIYMNGEESYNFNKQLSIIIPVYNTEKFLGDCIESILKQKFEKFELILVDDGSTDRSGIICDEYTKKDSRIRVIHSKNQGLSAARNLGLSMARYDWIAFVDSDDTIEEDMYEKMLDMVFKESVSMAICSANYMSEDGKSKKNIEQKKKLPKKEVISSHQMITEKLWKGSYENNLFTAPWNKVIKKELLGNRPFREGVIWEDDLLANTLFIKKYKIGIINEALYNWRMRKNSISHQSFDEKRAFFLEILYLRVHVLEKYGFVETANETAKMFVEFYIEYLYKAKVENKEECVIAYKKYLPEMMKFANKYRGDLKDIIKFNIRYRIFKVSPPIYYKIFF